MESRTSFINNNFFILDPSEKLYFSNFQQDKSAIIKIKNISESDIAFKLKSNAPKLYLVSPSKGVVKLGKTQTLKVNLRAGDIEESHSFMILAQQISENTDLGKIWQNQRFVQKSKLKVSTSKLTEEPSIKSLAEETFKLEGSLSEIIEELKICRIKTLKHNCERDRDFTYTHGILTFVSGLLFGLLFPAFFN